MSYIQHGEFRVLGKMSNNTNNPLEHSLPPVRGNQMGMGVLEESGGVNAVELNRDQFKEVTLLNLNCEVTDYSFTDKTKK